MSDPITVSVVVYSTTSPIVSASATVGSQGLTGLPELFLPAMRVSPNSNSPYTIGAVGTNNAVVFTMGDGADVVLLTITIASTGYAAPSIAVNPDGDLSTEGTSVKNVMVSCSLHRVYVIGGTFANSDEVPIDTSLIPPLVYSGIYDGWHYWTDTGDPENFNTYVSADAPGDVNTYWQMGGTDPNAGTWAFNSDGGEWAENINFYGAGTNGELGTPICTPSAGTAADLISLVNSEEDLDGVISCAASGLSTGPIVELTATIRNAAQAEYAGQPCIVGDVPGPFDQFLNTTFPSVWTQVLDRRASAIADSGTVGRAVVESETKAEAFQALGGASVTTIHTTGSGSITLPDGAIAMSFVLIGGGGGGGSGRRGAANTIRCGGGGGAGANVIVVPPTPVGAWSWPLSYTVGGGGSGGAAVTVDGSNGYAGTSGGASVFAGFNTGYIGAGVGGTASAGTGGAITFNSMFIPHTTVDASAGGESTTGGGIGGAGTNKTILIPTGGGSGGSISSGNSGGSGGSGGRMGYASVYAVTGGGGGGVGAAGSAGNTCPLTRFGSGGGGGGSGGKDGGNGGNYGAGGGGGGASLNGTASGKGGNGAAGLLMVTFHF